MGYTAQEIADLPSDWYGDLVLIISKENAKRKAEEDSRKREQKR